MNTNGMAYRRFILPASVLAGAIIGAGVFSLPYTLQPLGAALAIGLTLVVAAALTLLHLLYADIIARTPGEHNFVGFAQFYFGRSAFWLAIVMTVVEMFFVKLIYLVLSESFFHLFSPSWRVAGVVLFWALGSVTLALNIKRFAFFEFLITVGMIVALLIIFAMGIWAGEAALPRLSIPLGAAALLIPIGPLLFSLSGRVAVAETVAYVKAVGAGARDVRRAIVLGTAVPAAFYILFVLAAWMLAAVPSPDAVAGLVGVLSPRALWVVGALGLLSLFSSYIVVALNVKNILVSDLRTHRTLAIALIVAAPIALYFAGFHDFLRLVGIAGGVFLSIEGIMVLRMWNRLNHRADLPPPQIVGRIPRIAITAVYILLIAALLGVFVV